MKKLSCLLLGTFILASSVSQASGLLCEGLFVANSEIEKAAEKLVRFRIEIAETKDTTKKSIQSREFSEKYRFFLNESRDPDRARKIYAETDVKLRAQLKRTLQSQRNKEKKELQAHAEEEDLVQRWTRVRKKIILSYTVEKIIPSPDSSKVFILSGGHGHLYDAQTLEEIQLPFGLDQKLNEIKNASFSADGKQLIIYGNSLRILDLQNLNEVLNIDLVPFIPSGGFPHQVLLSPDRSRFVIAGYNSYAIYSVATTTLTYQSPKLRGFRNIKAKFSDDSKRLIIEGEDILVQDLATLKTTAVLDPADFENAIFSLDDGKTLTVYTSKGSRRVLNLKTGALETKAILKLDRNKEAKVLADLRNSQIVFIESQKTTVVDMKTNRQHSFATPESAYPEVTRLSPDGQYLFMTGGLGDPMHIFNLNSGEPIFMEPIKIASPGTSVFTPDGERFFVGACFGSLYVWFRKASDAAKVKIEE